MANALYDLGREKFLKGSISWNSDNIKVCLVSAAYVRNLATDEFLSSLGANIVATSGNLGSKTTTVGVADAADVTFTAVSGVAVTQIVGYKDTGVAGTSPLIFNIDVAIGMPITPNGSDISISWDNGGNKIFKL